MRRALLPLLTALALTACAPPVPERILTLDDLQQGLQAHGLCKGEFSSRGTNNFSSDTATCESGTRISWVENPEAEAERILTMYPNGYDSTITIGDHWIIIAGRDDGTDMAKAGEALGGTIYYPRQ